METQFTPIMSAVGGGLIGLSAVILLATTGRIAGVSGIASRLLPPDTLTNGYAMAFVIGLLLAVPGYYLVTGAMPEYALTGSMPWLMIAGLLVGFGSVLGNGCTSGHGVCGLSRLSPRSLVATGAFMVTAFITVLVVRHV